jgi:hypothetical protein
MLKVASNVASSYPRLNQNPALWERIGEVRDMLVKYDSLYFGVSFLLSCCLYHNLLCLSAPLSARRWYSGSRSLYQHATCCQAAHGGRHLTNQHSSGGAAHVIGSGAANRKHFGSR